MSTLHSEWRSVYCSMAKEKSTRVIRLIAALDRKCIPERERARYMHEQTAKLISYWSGVLAGDRPFGDKAARAAEEALKLPHLYLEDEGLSRDAMELAEMFDQLDEHSQAVLTATAHALMKPSVLDAPAAPPAPPPTPAPGLRPRTLDA